MRFTTSFAVLAFPAFAAAQIYGPPPGPASPSSSSASSSSSAAPAFPSAPPDTPGFMNVDVAFNETFTFNPNNFTAANGTVVTFFFPANGLSHSVTQSSFAEPCTPLAANQSLGTPAGFDSDLQQGVQFSITIVNDSQPIWFHCKQIDHCGGGMVGAINAPTTGNNTFQNFMANAMAIGTNEVTEPTGSVVTGGLGAVASASPTNSASVSAGSSSGSGGSGSPSSANRITAASGALGLIATAISMFLFA